MRKLFVAVASCLAGAIISALNVSAAEANGCRVSGPNLTTGDARCRSGSHQFSPARQPRTGSQNRASRSSTVEEAVRLFKDKRSAGGLDRSDFEAGGQLDGVGRCIANDTGTYRWSGSTWTKVGQAYGLCSTPITSAPKITPAEAAATAIARVRFTSASPGAGPNRGINKLPFDVAVGYPVWLWAEGGTTAARTATDEVGGRSVRLTVGFDRVTWDMGDGSRLLTCGVGTKWGPASKTGATSPTCGYSYERMGEYTITATTHWRIDWVVDGVSGSQEYALAQRRSWSVGELQVLVR